MYFKKLTLTTQKFSIKPGTKTVYILDSEKTEEIDETHYNNVVDSSPFFRRLGGSEYHEKSYTCAGYVTTRLISKSPDRENKTIRLFNFS